MFTHARRQGHKDIRRVGRACGTRDLGLTDRNATARALGTGQQAAGRVIDGAIEGIMLGEPIHGVKKLKSAAIAATARGVHCRPRSAQSRAGSYQQEVRKSPS
ncbi:hypothetical protein [Caballeronia sp. AZ7_KS35]|uniref:hypothetical protein n=1 Tax=Caballeronia sp. AZ7_KS35 TaxID=2921762 RepID=UPI00202948ED|nr:hypothetical protein [Caballeronia sp. AZ7_KS35]